MFFDAAKEIFTHTSGIDIDFRCCTHDILNDEGTMLLLKQNLFMTLQSFKSNLKYKLLKQKTGKLLSPTDWYVTRLS